MEYKDYYKIMGLSRSASQDEIKQAYRKLARKYHPDVSKEADAEKRFKEIGEAYEVLKDSEKRAAYDQLGANWKSGQDFRPPPGWEFNMGGGPRGGGDAHFSDFFDSLFGGGFGGGGFGGAGRRPGGPGRGGFSPRPGEDQNAKIRISIEDAYHGASRTLHVQSGHGGTQTLNVKIPKGIKAGQQIRLSGKGSPGIAGGPPGDLYLEVEFEPHAHYRLEGKDVYLSLPVTPWEAALGAKLTVPTLGGQVSVTLPPGSQSGKKMRLKEKGLPGNPAGDFYLELQIQTPPADNDTLRDLYQQLADASQYDPRKTLF